MLPTSPFRRTDAASHALPNGLIVATAGRVFVFNPTGCTVWEAFAQPQSHVTLFAHLAAHHHLSEALFQAEVVPFVEHLYAVGLVERVNG